MLSGNVVVACQLVVALDSLLLAVVVERRFGMQGLVVVAPSFEACSLGSFVAIALGGLVGEEVVGREWCLRGSLRLDHRHHSRRCLLAQEHSNKPNSC